MSYPRRSLEHQPGDVGNNVGLDQTAGLNLQAARNITGAQQGPPAPPEVIGDIVNFEKSLSTAQLIVPGVGRLDSDGVRGDPEELSRMEKAAGRFDLFDAWIGHSNPRRAQIARGQEIFNSVNANNRSCNGCHSSKNNGTTSATRCSTLVSRRRMCVPRSFVVHVSQQDHW